MSQIKVYARSVAEAFQRVVRDYWSEPLNVGFSFVTLFIVSCALSLGGFFVSVSPLELSCPKGFETEEYYIKCEKADYDRRRLDFNKLAESRPYVAYRTILLRDRIKDTRKGVQTDMLRALRWYIGSMAIALILIVFIAFYRRPTMLDSPASTMIENGTSPPSRSRFFAIAASFIPSVTSVVGILLAAMTAISWVTQYRATLTAKTSLLILETKVDVQLLQFTLDHPVSDVLEPAARTTMQKMTDGWMSEYVETLQLVRDAYAESYTAIKLPSQLLGSSSSGNE